MPVMEWFIQTLPFFVISLYWAIRTERNQRAQERRHRDEMEQFVNVVRKMLPPGDELVRQIQEDDVGSASVSDDQASDVAPEPRAQLPVARTIKR